MAINADWVRWLAASIGIHFSAVKGDYTLYIEGDERDTDDLRTFGELRVDGPFIKTLPNRLYYLDVEINILIQSHMDPQDLYAGLKAVGQFATGFENVIKVYKFGDGPNDDDTLLGCLRLMTSKNDNTIDISQFGIIRQDTRITQYTIEGHYRMELQPA